MGLERLDKILAAQGTWSRKNVKALIGRGMVMVDGTITRCPEKKIDPETAQVAIDGHFVTLRHHVYLLLNKPTGVVSATRDTSQQTVLDLVPLHLRRRGLFPAGRLDKDTTGMMLITDDGDFAHRILAPKNHIPKVYLVRLDKPITHQMIEAFSQGLLLGKDHCLPALLEVEEETLGRVTLYQGMYHQIKRMFGVFGAQVISLHRIAMGGLSLDKNLAEGVCRELTSQEIEKMTQGFFKIK